VPEFRLHIFQKDYENAKKILIDNKIICPHCRAKIGRRFLPGENYISAS